MIIDPNDLIQSRKMFDSWQEFVIPAAAVGAGANAPTWDTTEVGWNFSNNPPNNQEVQSPAEMPHEWREGSTVDVHLHWYLLVGGAGGEDVKWDLLYRFASVGGVYPAGWTPLSVTVDVSAYAIREHLMTEFTAIALPGETLSCGIDLRLQRDTADAADDHEQDVIMKHLDIHYRADSFGSVNDDVKWGG